MHFDEKTILIAARAGSLGRMAERTTLNQSDLSQIVIFSRDELEHYEMVRKFLDSEFPCMH